MKIEDSTHASSSVNHAPCGTFSRADERKTASRAMKTIKTGSTISILIRQIMIATSDTMHEVMNVTRITQTPYAFPRLVVYVLLLRFKNGLTTRVPTHVVIHGRDYDGTNHQQPICERDIYLAMKDLRGMDPFNLRKVGELHDLGEYLESVSLAALESKDEDFLLETSP